MATEVPSPIRSVSLAAMARGRNASCLVSLVHRAAKPEVFGHAGGPVYPSEVIALGPEGGVELHGIVLGDQE